MAIPSFPIPEKKPTVQAVDDRLQLQDDVLGGLYATAQGAVDDRINAQAAVLGGLANTAVKTVERRIRAQSKLLEPVIGTAIQAVDDAIARQGAQLAIHSEVFPRTYPGQSDTPSSLGPAYAPLSPAPSSTAESSGTTPSSGGPGTTQGNGRVVGYAVLADCEKKSLGVWNLADVSVQFMVRTGKFVPLRYGTVDDLKANFLGEFIPALAAFSPTFLSVACHAYENNGAGWPVNGDFLTLIPPYTPGLGNMGYSGEPVGDWPFPR